MLIIITVLLYFAALMLFSRITARQATTTKPSFVPTDARLGIWWHLVWLGLQYRALRLLVCLV